MDDEQLLVPIGEGRFAEQADISLMTIQVAGRSLLRLDAAGKVVEVDPELRTALGATLWAYLRRMGLTDAVLPRHPEHAPEEFADAALVVLEALAPFLRAPWLRSP